MIDSVHGTYSGTFKTAGQIWFRLRSRPSQKSVSWFLRGRFGDPGRFSGWALSPSLSCSSCRTSSVFSFRRSPGSSEAFTMLEENRSTRELFTKKMQMFTRAQPNESKVVTWLTPSELVWGVCGAVACLPWRCLSVGYLSSSFPNHTGHFPLRCMFSCYSQKRSSVARVERSFSSEIITARYCIDLLKYQMFTW